MQHKDPNDQPVQTEHDSIAAMFVSDMAPAQPKETKQSAEPEQKQEVDKEYLEITAADLEDSENPGVKEFRGNGFYIRPVTQKSLFKDFKRGQVKFAIGDTLISNEIFYHHIQPAEKLKQLLEEKDHNKLNQALKDALEQQKENELEKEFRDALEAAYQAIGKDKAELEKTLEEINHAWAQNCLSTTTNFLHAALETASAPDMMLTAPAPKFYQGTIYLPERKLIAVEDTYSMSVVMGATPSTPFAIVHKKPETASSDSYVEMQLVTPKKDTKTLQAKIDQLTADQKQFLDKKDAYSRAKTNTLGRQLAGLIGDLKDQRPQFKITKIGTKSAFIHGMIMMKDGKMPSIDAHADEITQPTQKDYQSKVSAELRQAEQGESKISEQEIEVKASTVAVDMHEAAIKARKAMVKAATKLPSPRPAPQSESKGQSSAPVAVAKRATATAQKADGSVLKAAAWAALGCGVLAGSYIGGGAAFAALSPVITPPGAAGVAGGILTVGASAGIVCTGKAHDQYRRAPAKQKSIARMIGWGLLGAATAVASYFAAATALTFLSPFITPAGAAAVACGILIAGTSAALLCVGKAKERKAAKKKVKIEIARETETDTPSPSPQNQSRVSISSTRSITPPTPITPVRKQVTFASKTAESPTKGHGKFESQSGVGGEKQAVMARPGNMRKMQG